MFGASVYRPVAAPADAVIFLTVRPRRSRGACPDASRQANGMPLGVRSRCLTVRSISKAQSCNSCEGIVPTIPGRFVRRLTTSIRHSGTRCVDLAKI
jgi:hypothetical protein